MHEAVDSTPVPWGGGELGEGRKEEEKMEGGLLEDFVCLKGA